MAYTAEQQARIRDAAYKIAEAKAIFDEVNADMIAKKQWNGQGDIQAICAMLEQVTAKQAGGVGEFLEAL